MSKKVVQHNYARIVFMGYLLEKDKERKVPDEVHEAFKTAVVDGKLLNRAADMPENLQTGETTINPYTGEEDGRLYWVAGVGAYYVELLEGEANNPVGSPVE